MALWVAIDRLVKSETATLKSKATPEFTSALTELVYTQAGILYHKRIYTHFFLVRNTSWGFGELCSVRELGIARRSSFEQSCQANNSDY